MNPFQTTRGGAALCVLLVAAALCGCQRRDDNAAAVAPAEAASARAAADQAAADSKKATAAAVHAAANAVDDTTITSTVRYHLSSSTELGLKELSVETHNGRVAGRCGAAAAAPLVRSRAAAHVLLRACGRASRVELGSTLTGRVREVLVAEGATVRQGDVLVRLESEELRAALAQARASERQAAARLAGLRSTGRKAAQAGVAQADSVLQAAQAELQRTQELVARGFLSEARLDDARRAVAVAQAQLAGASAQRAANAEQGTDVTQAQAQLALAQLRGVGGAARLAQAVLTAPAMRACWCALSSRGRSCSPGARCSPWRWPVRRSWRARSTSAISNSCSVGQAARVSADAFPSQRFEARVLSIAPLVDAQRGAVEVKLSLPQAPPAFLREDMTLSVQVETGRRERTLVVPVQALAGDREARSDGTATVFVARRTRRATPVRLGLRHAGRGRGARRPVGRRHRAARASARSRPPGACRHQRHRAARCAGRPRRRRLGAGQRDGPLTRTPC
jgi:HlyD family secretion protein